MDKAEKLGVDNNENSLVTPEVPSKIGDVAINSSLEATNTPVHNGVVNSEIKKPRNISTPDSDNAQIEDSFQLFSKSISKFPLLNKDEEVELSKKIEAGREAKDKLEAGINNKQLIKVIEDAEKAKKRFIYSNLRLVISIARKYPRNNSMSIMDLVQEGYAGLERAVERFDWRRGFKFSTYATWWINQAMSRAYSQQSGLIRLPHPRFTKLRDAKKKAELDNKFDMDKLQPEIAYLHQLNTPVSLDLPVNPDSDTSLGDFVAINSETPEDNAVESDNIKQVHELLSTLDPRDRNIVELRFGIKDGTPKDYRQIAALTGLSHERVRQLEHKARHKIKMNAIKSGINANIFK